MIQQFQSAAKAEYYPYIIWKDNFTTAHCYNWDGFFLRFSQNSTLENIEIKSYMFDVRPDSIFNPNIETFAFANTIKLKNFTIPSQITFIDSLAFFDCSLPTLILPETVTDVGYFLLESNIGKIVQEGDNVFDNSAYTSYGLFETNRSFLKTAEVNPPVYLDRLFANNPGLLSVNFKGNNLSYAPFMFLNDSSLTQIDNFVMACPITIPNSCFKNCSSYNSSLNSILFDCDLVAVEDYGCENFGIATTMAFHQDTIPFTFGIGSFQNNPRLQNLDLSNSLISLIDSKAFANTSALISVNLDFTQPNITLADDIFLNSSVKIVSIRDGLTNLASKCFSNLASLTTFIMTKRPIPATNPLDSSTPFIINQIDLQYMDANKNIILSPVDGSSYLMYTSAASNATVLKTGGNQPYRMNPGIIGDYAFANDTNLQYFDQYDGYAMTIGDYAFSGCTSLKGLAIYLDYFNYNTAPSYQMGINPLFKTQIAGTSIPSLGKYAFQGCTALEYVAWGFNTTIAEGTFKDSGLKYIAARDGLYTWPIEHIGAEAFTNTPLKVLDWEKESAFQYVNSIGIGKQVTVGPRIKNDGRLRVFRHLLDNRNVLLQGSTRGLLWDAQMLNGAFSQASMSNTHGPLVFTGSTSDTNHYETNLWAGPVQYFYMHSRSITGTYTLTANTVTLIPGHQYMFIMGYEAMNLGGFIGIGGDSAWVYVNHTVQLKEIKTSLAIAPEAFYATFTPTVAQNTVDVHLDATRNADEQVRIWSAYFIDMDSPIMFTQQDGDTRPTSAAMNQANFPWYTDWPSMAIPVYWRGQNQADVTAIMNFLNIEDEYKDLPTDFSPLIGQSYYRRNLTVNDGSGGGKFVPGDKVSVIPVPVNTGQVFSRWDVVPLPTYVEGTSDASWNAKFLMPNSDTVATPIFTSVPLYNLTVINGTSALSSYAENATVVTTANPAPIGYEFIGWTFTPAVPTFLMDNQAPNKPSVQTSNISVTPWFVMLGADMTATANYSFIPYTVTVNKTDGTQSFTRVYGDVVTITNTSLVTSNVERTSGTVFSQWNITPSVTFVNGTSATSNSAQFLMPASNVTATAQTKTVYPVTVVNGILDWYVYNDANLNYYYAPNDVVGVWTKKIRMLYVPQTDASTALPETEIYVGLFNYSPANQAPGLIVVPMNESLYSIDVIPMSKTSVTFVSRTTTTTPRLTISAIYDIVNLNTNGTVRLRYDITPRYSIFSTSGNALNVVGITISLISATGEGPVYIGSPQLTIYPVPEGQSFLGWEAVPNVSFVNNTSEKDTFAYFTMPSSAVTITATYGAISTYNWTVHMPLLNPVENNSFDGYIADTPNLTYIEYLNSSGGRWSSNEGTMIDVNNGNIVSIFFSWFPMNSPALATEVPVLLIQNNDTEEMFFYSEAEVAVLSNTYPAGWYYYAPEPTGDIANFVIPVDYKTFIEPLFTTTFTLSQQAIDSGFSHLFMIPVDNNYSETLSIGTTMDYIFPIPENEMPSVASTIAFSKVIGNGIDINPYAFEGQITIPPNDFSLKILWGYRLNMNDVDGGFITIPSKYPAPIIYNSEYNNDPVETWGFLPGDQVVVSIDPLQNSTRKFVSWIMDSVPDNFFDLDSLNHAPMQFKMPGNELNITTEVAYSVTLMNGTLADGQTFGYFEPGVTTVIVADAPPSGQSFLRWDSNISIPASLEASFVMPEHEVTATAVYGYLVTVVNGTGSGVFVPGATVNIRANNSGLNFIRWESVDVTPPTTWNGNFIMPNKAVTITAIYSYQVTITGGTGSGTYQAGDTVVITATGGGTGYAFNRWTTSPASLTYVDGTSQTTQTAKFTMPSQNVTATSSWTPLLYTVTVNGGAGSGTYQVGTAVTITATGGETGYTFNQWTTSPTTLTYTGGSKTTQVATFTMPAQNVTVTSSWKLASYAVTVNGGTGSGTYQFNSNVTISGTGEGAFMQWTTNPASLIYTNNTTQLSQSARFTMPAQNVIATSNFIGSNWSGRNSGLDAKNSRWRIIAYGNGLFVAFRMIIQTSTDTHIDYMTSPNGLNWTLRNTGLSENYRPWGDIVYGNDRFVVISNNVSATNGIALTSTSGTSWTRQTTSDTFLNQMLYNGITYGNGLFVAVGQRGQTSYSHNTVATSPDGVTWTARQAASTLDTTWRSVAYGNNRFVAIASSGTGNRAMTSTNGTTWTARSTPNSDSGSWVDIVYGNNLFVAVSSGGETMTSPDGITWTIREAPTYNAWTSIAYGDNRFMVVSGSNNRTIASSNGINWGLQETPNPNSWSWENNNGWTGIAYGGGRFVAVADLGGALNNPTTTNDIITSP